MPVRLRAGAPGSLRVLVDGKELYSKKEAKHSASADDIVRLIRQVAG